MQHRTMVSWYTAQRWMINAPLPAYAILDDGVLKLRCRKCGNTIHVAAGEYDLAHVKEHAVEEEIDNV